MTDPNCIFCKIVSGEIPSHKIYEDDLFFAFLDIHPQSAGHVQVIPKEHYRWVWDVPQIGKYFEVTKRLALAQQKAFGVEGIWSRITGEEIPHAHIWIFPDPRISGDKTDFAGNAERIKKNLI